MEGPPVCDEGPIMSVMSPERGSARGIGGGGGFGASGGMSLRQSMNALAATQRGRLSMLHVDEELQAAAAATSTGHARSTQEEMHDESPIEIEPYIAEEPPRGRHLLINLLATYGAKDDIGLTGIELFDSAGRLVPINAESVFDSYEVPEFEKNSPSFVSASQKQDPRRNPANLFNGVNNTTDSTQMYLVPFTPGGHHIVCCVLPQAIELSMIRIFNYNADRVHVQKGTQILEMTLDDEVIFRGHVSEGPGSVCYDKHGVANCENIIYNDDPAVLSAVLAWTNGVAQQEEEQTRPDSASTPEAVDSAITHALQQLTMKFANPTEFVPCAFPHQAPTVRGVSIAFHSTWGDDNWVGLSGIQFQNENGMDIFVGGCSVERPSGESIPGDGDVSSVLDNDPSTAAVWSFEAGMKLTVAFAQPSKLGRIRVANYGLLKGTHCGAKLVSVIALAEPEGAQNYLLSPPDGVVLRKAPSNSFTLRFQSFDISLAAADLGISAGHYLPADNNMLAQAQGGMGGGMTSSMTASMTTRARIAMKRARMSLKQPPEWLQSFQPYAVPLLPVAYVFKFSFRVNKASITQDTAASFLSNDLWAAAVCGLDEEGKALTPDSCFCEEDGFSSIEATFNAQFETKVVFWIFDAPVAVSAIYLQNTTLAPLVTEARYCADDEIVVELTPKEDNDEELNSAQQNPIQLVVPTGGAVGECLSMDYLAGKRDVAPTTAFFTYDEAVLARFMN